MIRNPREWQDDQLGKPQLGLPPTARQIEVFLTVLATSSEKAAAEQLGISRWTVSSHTVALMARLGAESAAEAARILWERFPNVRPLMNIPANDGLGQRHERRIGQRRK